MVNGEMDALLIRVKLHWHSRTPLSNHNPTTFYTLDVDLIALIKGLALVVSFAVVYLLTINFQMVCFKYKV